MAQGLSRREETNVRTAGAEGFKPASIPQGMVMRPNPARAYKADTAASDFLDFGAELLAGLAEKEAVEDTAAGEVAFAQGKTMSELEASGASRHTVRGFESMAAATEASVLFETQLNAISEGEYKADPMAFRETLAERNRAAMEGKSPEMQKLVGQLAARHQPQLAAAQLKAHYAWREEETFNGLVNAVEHVSRDPISLDTLAFVASGQDGSPASSLSKERRVEAMIEGVSRAFAEGNPKAFAILSQSGVIDKADLSAAQTTKLRAAKELYESKAREGYDEDYMQTVTTINEDLAAGVIDLPKAVELKAAAHAERGWDVTRADMAGLYDLDAGERAQTQAVTGANLETLRVAGDYTGMARAMTAAVRMAETGNNPNAVHPLITAGANKGDRAQGVMGVMPKTMADPGFGVKPVKNPNDPEEVAEFGVAYLAAMLEYVDGDVEAAAIAYNAGPGNAKLWLASGRDYSVLPKPEETKPYAKKIMKMVTGGDTGAFLPAKRTAAEAAVKAATDAAALDAYTAMATDADDLKRELDRGNLTRDDYVTQSKALWKKYDTTASKSDVNGLFADVRAAEAQRYQATVDQNILQDAINTNTIGDLGKDKQKQAFGLKAQQISRKYTDLVAAKKMTQEEASRRGDADMRKFRMQAGVVDARLAGVLNAALTVGVLGPDGMPSEGAVAALDEYKAMQKIDEQNADLYLSPEAADLVALASSQMLAASSPAEALQTAANLIATGDAEKVKAEFENPVFQTRMTELAEGWIEDQNIGFFGALISGKKELGQYWDSLSVDQDTLMAQANVITRVIKSQALGHRLRNPGLTPEAAIERAGKDIQKRVAVMGSNVLVVPEGVDIQTEMFGDRQGDFDLTATPNSALNAYLKEFGNTDEMWGSEFNSSLASRAFRNMDFSSVGAAIDSIDDLGTSAKNFDQGVREQLRGAPEYSVQYSPQGPGVIVRYMRPNGEWSERAQHITFEMLGSFYKEVRQYEETGESEAFPPAPPAPDYTGPNSLN